MTWSGEDGQGLEPVAGYSYPRNVIIGAYRLLVARHLLFVTVVGRLVLHDASYRCALLFGYPPRFTIHEPLQSKLV